MRRIDRVLLCTCEGSQSVDAASAGVATGAEEVVTADRLCTGDIETAAAALRQDGTTLIACGQMASLFEDLIGEVGGPGEVVAADIRDRAGWTSDGRAFAKQAALLAEARLVPPATPTKDVVSEGTVLVLGAGEAGVSAAESLAEAGLAATLLLPADPGDLAPTADYDMALGRLKSATGALGGFAVTVEGYRQMQPGGRGPARFSAPQETAHSTCDIVLDLRGEGPIFPADHKREGYVRADARDPAAVARAIASTVAYQGVFEKPLYIRFEESLCAHSRAGQPGCTRCLSVCPTGAIAPAGDTVAIDADICAGCGACAAVCPSGAASYDDPPAEFLFQRLRALASAYRDAGGTAPRALFHDAEHGGEMIRLLARFGDGLPADVIPVEVANVETVGHAELLAALGVGFASAGLLVSPRSDRAVLDAGMALAEAVAAGAGKTGRVHLIDVADPDALPGALAALPALAPGHDPILPLGGRREVTRIAAAALAAPQTPNIPLPEGAPYGAIVIDQDACTLCLACVSLCPVGALGDSPDKPQVNFQETACLQCGVCAAACPEDAIALAPGLDLSKEAFAPRILNEEEPFECISCGKPFGTRSTIEKIVEKLDGQHWMYRGSDNARLIQMCDDCRVQAQYHQDASPFRMGERPRVRTTEDYLDEKKEN
ncbi:MAG: 4Fe-4S binding protein [Paracoccaceae bacterium]|nr:4Fe-4S binding protein [Paracoccaceae bacterium]